MRKNKKALRFYIFSFAFLFFIFPVAGAAEAVFADRIFVSKPENKEPAQIDKPSKKKKKKKGTSKPKVNQAKLISVAAGNWGAAGVNFIVEDDGAKIEYDCATGEITQKLLIDEGGSFSADGVYTRLYPGARRVNLPPKRAAARYEGKISGDKMTLKVTLTETGETLEEVVLERNVTARIRRCY